MFARFIGKTRKALILLSFVPATALASDDALNVEEAGEATSELIAYTRVLFDCDMLIESIEPSQFQSPEIYLYFVTLKAEGVECEQAFDVLNRRGRNKGLFFQRAKEPEEGAELPAGTNFDLIHEIDPEVED